MVPSVFLRTSYSKVMSVAMLEVSLTVLKSLK